jgi:hypothetical protein
VDHRAVELKGSCDVCLTAEDLDQLLCAVHVAKLSLSKWV